MATSRPGDERPAPIDRLLEDGYLVREGDHLRSSPRWQASMAQASRALQRAGAPWRDLRLPIALALAHRYGALPDDELAALVEAMLPIEEDLVPPLFGEDPGVVDTGG